MAKAGRKNKYFTHVQSRLEEIGHWCREGLVETEICKRLGVGISNWERYKNAFRELRDSLKKNKEIADYRVEKALYLRACGYEYEEVTEEPAVDVIVEALRRGEKFSRDEIRELVDDAMIVTKLVKKHLAPDPVSMIFWLKNRKPDKWRVKQEVGGNITVNYSVPEIEKE